MRKYILLSLAILASLPAFSQDQTNKGKDFWIPYPEHIDGATSVMGLYITSDLNSTGVITVGATTIPFTVTPNNVTRTFIGPGGSVTNANVYLGGYYDNVVSGKSIHVTATTPVVVFAHIIKSARSGATLVLPTKVWSKEYIVPSYQNSGGAGAGQGYPELDVFASKPNTVIEITPRANSRNGAHPAGTAFQVTLPNVGDVYQLEFAQNTDMSGTTVKSVALAAGGCSPIAVFSATTWSAINCGSGNGGDNFFQQLFPAASWGKSFLTGPLKKVATAAGDNNVDLIRVFVKDASTVVTRTDNGITTTLAGLVSPANYYEFSAFRPNLIQADKPIEVMQYITTQNCGSPITNSDPEMIALSSIEQTINDITVFSAHQNWVPPGQSQVSKHYINVIMKTANTGLFKINGAAPAASFTAIPGTVYSYLKEEVTSTALTNPVFHLVADSGFNAIAYGLGNVESYGYNAGTNVKDLYQQIGVSTTYGIETTPSVCTGTPFKFKVSLPYCADSIAWDLSGLPVPPTPAFDTIRYTTCLVGPGGPDSSFVVNGTTVNWYSLPNPYQVNTVGVYNINITSFFPNGECGNSQDIPFQLTVSNPPVADFSFTTPGCYAEPVQFTETTPQVPKPTYHFWWSFGDPASGGANTSAVRNPTHTFSGPGTYTVRFSDITTPGCLSDTISHTIIVPDLPSATITGTSTVCINDPFPNVVFTGANGTPPYTFSYTIDNGGGPGPIQTITTTAPSTSVTIPVSTFTAGTFTYTLVRVKNTGSTFCTQNQSGSAVITVRPDATITLTSGAGSTNQTVCINNPITNITYSIGGSGSGANVVFTPALPGVTGVYAAGAVTISGTPTLAGSYSYTVTTVGPCQTPALSGTITVTDNATITLSSGAGTDNQTVCINTPITTISYIIGGTATGASISPVLPAGLTGTYSGGVYTISGTPTSTVGSPYNYTITTTGPCVTPQATGTITITADATINLTSAPATTSQTVCINTAITNITYSIGGSGTAANVVFTPALPGVTGVYAGGVVTISGTPTLAGSYSYTVTPVSPCLNPPLSGTITVNDNATIALTSGAGSDNQTVCINTPINNISYAIGGSGTGAAITAGALPAGVTGSFAGGVFNISGTPTVSGVFNYTVTTTGLCINNSISGTITIKDNSTIALTSAAGTNVQTVCVNSAIVTITYALGGGATSASISAGVLPAGVTGTFAGGVFTISGTPTASGVYNYTVSAVGPCVNPSLSGTITVNANASITLVSGAGTDAQTACINNPILNISYSIGGGGTGASITAGALPAGVTGVFAGGVFTISGTPTVNGVFNYTVTTISTCTNTSASGTITVNNNSTLTLTSAAGTSSQTVCINTPITSITYAVGSGGIGAAVTAGALPAGVTGSYAGGVFTISGTPTVFGVYNYTVTTTGPCTNPSLSGTITVNDNSTITLTSGAGSNTQTVCINNPIGNISYSVAGGGTGASITAGALPAGVTGSYVGGVFTISGTPTVAGVFNYTVTTTGPCVNNSLSGTITVNNNSTLTLTSAAGSNTQTVCVNNAITTITYSIGGGGTGASITAGVLPAGVTGTFAGGVFTISGTPTASGVFPYTVTTAGPCNNAGLSGTLTVNANSTINLTSGAGSDAQTVCINNAIANISYTIAGGGTGASITAGALPAGVTGSFAGGVFTISGTPTVSGVFNYTVTTTGPCINNAKSGTITVNANSTMTLTSAAGSNTQTVCINNAITTITYAVGGAGTGASITAGGLPAGVTGTFAGGVFTISGTPTASGVFPYTVTTTGPCNNPALSGTITVNANSTISLTSAAGSDAQTVCINTAITDILYTIAGGGTGASITAGALPAGVTGSFAGGVFTISGTPTVSGVFNYTVTTTGPCINNVKSGTITVNANSTLALTSAAGSNTQTVCINNAITTITYAVGGAGTGASITAGGLPAGVTGTFAGGVFTISGTPTASGVFPYTVTTTGPCNNPALSGTITVNANSTISLTSAAGSDAQTVCINTAITDILYTIAGGGTGASITAGALPAGVTGSYAGGVFTISGTPTVSGVFNYTVTTTGPCINNAKSGTITVNANSTLALTSAAGSNTQTVCINNAITTITYAVGGAGTGASITAGGLPAGVTGTFAGGVFTISGTPTASGVFPYTVTTTGPCNNPALSGTITVNANSTISLTSAAGSDAQTVCINTAITDILYTIAGGGTGASITAGALPAGVTGSYAGGVFTITGTPTVNGVFNYTVTTAGPCINNSKSGTITVNSNSTLTLTSAAGSDIQTVCINNAITNITYSIGGTGTGASISAGALPAGVAGNYAGGVFTISGTPTVPGVFSYTVTSTGPCGNSSLNGTITVNDNSSISLSSAAGTNTQAVCNNTAIVDITYAIGGGGTGASITAGALPAGVTGSYAAGVFTITGTPTASGTFNYTVTTTGPCINNSLSGSITVNPIPTATMSGSVEVCQNSAPDPSITFTGAGGTRPYTFTYTINGGAPLTVTTTAASNSVTVQQTTAVAGPFTYDLVSVADGSSTACSQPQAGSVLITVNPVPTATISGSKRICINSTPPDITFTGAGGTLPYTFTYTVNAGPAQTITTSGGSSSVTLPASTLAPGTFTYHLVSVKDGSASGCSQPQPGDAIIQVSDVFPNPLFTFDPSVCLPNALVQFQNNSNIADGTPLTYLWSFGDGNTSTAFAPSHVYVAVGPFNVDLQATSDAGCVKDLLIPMNNIHPHPITNFTTDRPSVCVVGTAVFADNSDPLDGTITSWTWDMGNGTSQTGPSFPYTYLAADTFYVSLHITTSYGCVGDTTKPFPVYDYPTVNAGKDDYILEGGTLVLNPTVTGQNLQYEWSPNLYLDNSTLQNPTIRDPKTDITYTLKVTGIGGCPKSDMVFIKLLKFPKIPNTFTPNTDGIHDTWSIEYLNTYPNNRVQVFTRAGQLVFESHGSQKAEWDGKLNGKPLPVDTYYYIIEPGNGRAPMTGYITLLR